MKITICEVCGYPTDKPICDNPACTVRGGIPQHIIDAAKKRDAEKAERQRIAKIRANVNRRAREQAAKDCGLVKVRGALGGIYWE
jgi:hypothetical protein